MTRTPQGYDLNWIIHFAKSLSRFPFVRFSTTDSGKSLLMLNARINEHRLANFNGGVYTFENIEFVAIYVREWKKPLVFD